MAKSQETSENIAAGISCPSFFQNSLCSDNSSPSAVGTSEKVKCNINKAVKTKSRKVGWGR